MLLFLQLKKILRSNRLSNRLNCSPCYSRKAQSNLQNYNKTLMFGFLDLLKVSGIYRVDLAIEQ